MAARKSKAAPKKRAAKRGKRKATSKRAKATKRRPAKAAKAKPKKVRAKPARIRKPVRAHPKKRAKKKRKISDARAIAEAQSAERSERARAAWARRKGDIRPELGLLLEEMRNMMAPIVPMSMDAVEQRGEHVTWSLIGRFAPQDEIDYETLAELLLTIRNDLVLETRVGPSRLAQLRVVYNDPNTKRGEDQGHLHAIGPWAYVIDELIGDLVGNFKGGEPAAMSLAQRYKETTVVAFYIYLANETVGGQDDGERFN